MDIWMRMLPKDLTHVRLSEQRIRCMIRLRTLTN